jgi:cytochrome P450
MTVVPITAVPDRAAFEAVFGELRERAAVVPVEIEGGLRAWVITRYAEGRAALKDPRLVKDLRTVNAFSGVRHAEDVFAVEGRHMLNSDGADHARLRSVAAGPLSASSIARLRPAVERIAGRLLDTVAEAESIDLMAAYARPLPELVMGQVLGVPDEPMLEIARLSRRLGQREDPASREMRRAYGDVVDLVRDQLGCAPPPGSVLAALRVAADAGRITRRELVSTVMMLVAAGTSSSTIAIGHGAALLASAAAALRVLLDSAGRSAELVEELIRHHPPFPFSPWRFAREPVEVDGVTIPQGAVVFVLLAAANRDPAAIERPEELLPGRQFFGHLTFGYGPHYCLGVHLARMEIQAALRELFARLPGLCLETPYPQVAWTGLLFDRTIRALPAFTRAPAAAAHASK